MTGYDVSTLTPNQTYKLLCGGVVPRPLAWVSCRSPRGMANIAPFSSFFNIVSFDPPTRGFSVSEPLVPDKDVKERIAAPRIGEAPVSFECVLQHPTRIEVRHAYCHCYRDR